MNHFSKLDGEKIKIYFEDLRLFFNIHNHPEIQINDEDITKKNVFVKNNFQENKIKKINLNDSSFDEIKNKNKYLNNNTIDCSQNYSNISNKLFLFLKIILIKNRLIYRHCKFRIF